MNTLLSHPMDLSFLPYVFSLLLILFIFPFARRLSKLPPNEGPKLPPGSSSWLPLLGHTISFIKPHRASSLGEFLEENIQRYGRIFRADLFGRPTVVSCDAEFNSFVLNNEERLFAASYPKSIPGVLGDQTLLVVQGEKHKQLRGLVVNLMTAVKNPEGSSFFSDIDDGARRVLGSWKDGETVVLCNETRKFTFGVIVKQILSLRPEDPEAIKILECYKTFMKGLTSLPLIFPGSPYSKAIKARHQIVDILRGIMRQRENRMREREEKEKKDFLDMLLADENLAEENVLSLMLDLLLGGYETTAMLIAIAVKYLSENPEILNELKEEHIELIKNKRGERLEWDDYKKMEFTQCLISESLRLGNVVKFLHRETTKSIQFKAYKIPAGWKVLPVITGVHLDPSLHSDPSSFNPYRWKRMDTNEKSFMPFGGGKRKCPGLELARLEAAIFIHHLALRYTWIPISQSDWPISHPYLDFKDGFQIAIKSRHV